jgi:hypothetical protein
MMSPPHPQFRGPRIASHCRHRQARRAVSSGGASVAGLDLLIRRSHAWLLPPAWLHSLVALPKPNRALRISLSPLDRLASSSSIILLPRLVVTHRLALGPSALL